MTPVSPVFVLGVELAMYVVYCLVSLATLAAAALSCGVRLRGSLPGFLGSWALTMLSTLSVGLLVGGVAKDTSIARIALIGLRHNPGVAFQVFDLLSKHNINVDLILQSIGREDSKDISFTVNEEDVENAIRIIEENKERLTFHEVTSNLDVAKVSIVGAGMTSNPGVAAKMFEALYNVGININMISTSEIRITVLVKKKDGEKAMNAIHEAFFGNVD